MKQAKYVGHADGCDLVLEDGSWREVEAGEIVKETDPGCSPGYIDSLLEQPPNWQPIGSDKKPAQLTGPQLDAAYGDLAGYPAGGKKAAKVEFVEQHLAGDGEQNDPEPQTDGEQSAPAGDAAAADDAAE